MKLRLRCKNAEKIRVYDSAGNEIEGVEYVSFTADANGAPFVTIKCRAEIVADVEAETVLQKIKSERGAIQAKSEIVPPKS